MIFRKAILQVIENPTFINLYKLAINMSDGIIAGSKNVSPEILAYAKKIRKPLAALSACR